MKITDEQIAAIRDSSRGLAVSPHINALAELALVETEEAIMVAAIKPKRRDAARVRLAELASCSRCGAIQSRVMNRDALEVCGPCDAELTKEITP